MISELEIRSRIQDVLNGASMGDFAEWLAAASWNMHQHSSRAAQRVAFAIALRFAEHDAGHLDDAGLKRELRAIADMAPFATTETVSTNSGEGRIVSRFVFGINGPATGSSAPSTRRETERLQLAAPLGGVA